MTLAVAESLPDTIYQRSPVDGKRRVPCRGTYNGNDPVEFRLVSGSLTSPNPLTSWAPVASQNPVTRQFTAEFNCTKGVWFRYQVRYAGDDTSIVTQQNKWGVGDQIWILGQSNGNRLFDYNVPVTLSGYSRVYQSLNADQPAKDTWCNSTGPGICALAQVLYGVDPQTPLGIVNLCKNGSKIAQWCDPTTTSPYGIFSRYFHRLGSDMRYVVWIQGEDDARIGTSKQDYKDYLSILYRRLRELTGRDDLVFIVCETGPVNYPEATELTKAAIREAQTEWATANVIYGGSLLDYAVCADGMHLTLDAGGTVALGTAIGEIIASTL